MTIWPLAVHVKYILLVSNEIKEIQDIFISKIIIGKCFSDVYHLECRIPNWILVRISLFFFSLIKTNI